jgi:hypothetical protein
LYRNVCVLYVQYIYTLHVCISTSGIVIHCIEWTLGPLSPPLKWKTLLASASRRGQSCQHWLLASLGNLPPLMTLGSSAGNSLALDWSELAALLLNLTLCTSHCWWNLIQLPFCAENCRSLPYFQLVCVVWYAWPCSWWCIFHHGCQFICCQHSLSAAGIPCIWMMGSAHSW